MAPKPRKIEQVAFRSDELMPITARMSEMNASGDGWINLIPRMSEDEDEEPKSLGFFSLFGGGGPGITMCTWIPGKAPAGQNPASLGISHVTGHRAKNDLDSRNTSIPTTWTVSQDHPSRGLVLQIPPDEPNEVVVAWALRAVRALGTPRPIKGWRADIYLTAS